MGEIIFSIFIGGILAVSGILMNLILKKEEKKFSQNGRKNLPETTKAAQKKEKNG